MVIAARVQKREAKWEEHIDKTKCTALIVFKKKKDQQRLTQLY